MRNIVTISPPKLPLLKTSFSRLLTYLCLVPCALCLAHCASPEPLTGGPKDETPPVMLSITPGNLSTHFKAQKIEFVFDEYIDLKDISKQLVVSPPMAKKPDIKKNGKKLEVTFKDSLLPDRTYAINFGDAIVDLNEGNPIKNYQYVFSTGATIDSLQVSGKVLQALDGKPAEDIVVMLYNGTADSLPLKTLPLYISRTNKQGRFTLKNLASGTYKIFALKDGNTNYKFDMASEAVAFQDSLVVPSVVLKPVDTLKAGKDTVKIEKTIETKKTEDGKTIDKKTIDKKTIDRRTGKTIDEKAKKKEETIDQDSLARANSKYRYMPDTLELRLFTEFKHNQYLSSTERPRRDQIRMKFNEATDSLGLEFLNLPQDSVEVKLEWYDEPDTIDFWIMKHSVAALDTLRAIAIYPGYDSIERRVAKSDTLKMRYRAPAKSATAPKKEFTVTNSVESTKSLDFGQSILFVATLPYTKLDTTLIRLTSGKDSSRIDIPFRMIPDTLKGLMLNGVDINQPHPRFVRLKAALVADTSYRLTMLPGAFIGINGQKSDSTDIRFKMKSKELYGSLKLDLPSVKGPVVLEILDGRNKVVFTRRLSSPGTQHFDLLQPGKYTARMIFDTNGNGKWDTGKYSTHYQPERVITFSKDLTIKANWEVTETWQW